MVVVGRHGAEGRLPAQRHQRPERLVVGGRRRRRRILRVEREEHDALAALRLQPLDHRACRGVAVAHREIDDHPVAVPLGQARRHRLRLRAGGGAQRALVDLAVPDLAVVGAGAERPPGQDHRLQQRLPQPARVVDDPPVGQELVEVAAHRPVVGGVRRAEVGEHDADPRRGHRRMVGRGMGQPAFARGRRCRGSVSFIAGLARRARSGTLRARRRAAPCAEPGRSGCGWSGRRRPAGQEDHLEGRRHPCRRPVRTGRRRSRRPGPASAARVGRRSRSRITLVSPIARRSRISVQRRRVADVEAPAVGHRQREARALQEPAEVADLAHRRHPRAEAAQRLHLGLGQRGAQLVERLAAEERRRGRARRAGARGAPAPAGRPGRSPSAAPARAPRGRARPRRARSTSASATARAPATPASASAGPRAPARGPTTAGARNDLG